MHHQSILTDTRAHGLQNGFKFDAARLWAVREANGGLLGEDWAGVTRVTSGGDRLAWQILPHDEEHRNPP